MRIGLDVTAAVAQGGGIGRYTRELLRALAAADPDNDYRLFFASRTRPHPLPPLGSNFRVTALPFHDIWLARLWQRARVPLPVQAVLGRLDLYHSPDFTLPPIAGRTPALLTVHDLSFVRDPGSSTPALRRYLNLVVPRSVARADHILADSRATRDDLIELYRTPEETITVLYSGVEPRFRPISEPMALAAIRSKYGLGPEPFILGISTLQPRKNFVRLVQAYGALPQAVVSNLQLVIAGGRGWLFDAIFSEVERLGLRGRVLFPGFVADADLPALYSAARVLAYPSLYEGFGLPLLEAMACGTPVVTSTASSLPEVAGDAALLVDPLDVAALADALQRAVEDEAVRAGLIERGFRRAWQFNWGASARQLIDLYGQLGRG
jgi:glycosyltransferase involved in cell wall biosynthesis